MKDKATSKRYRNQSNYKNDIFKFLDETQYRLINLFVSTEGKCLP